MYHPPIYLPPRQLSRWYTIIRQWRVGFILLLCGVALVVKPSAWAAPVPTPPTQNLPNQTVPPFDVQTALPLVSNRPLPVHITLGFEDAYSPTWSPDSSRVAFLATREITYPPALAELYVANFDGSGVTRIDYQPPEPLENSDGWMATHVDWSPKGDKIAISFYSCSSCEGHGAYNFHIYVMDSHGGELTRISTKANRPDWSPDGSRFAYTYQSSYADAEWFAVMDADGRNPVYLDYFVYGYTWSPDSRQLAYSSESNPQLLTINVDRSDLTILTEDAGSVHGPVWSPDGQQIAYLSTSLGDRELRVINPDERKPIPLIQTEWDYIGLVSWVPDSEQLIFWGRETPTAAPAFYLVNRDGSDLTQILPFDFPPNTVATAWSPDTTKLLFVADDNIYVLRVPHE